MAKRINWPATAIVETFVLACPYCEATKPIRKDMEPDDQGRWRYFVCRSCNRPFRNFENTFRKNGNRVLRIGDA